MKVHLTEPEDTARTDVHAGQASAHAEAVEAVESRGTPAPAFVDDSLDPFARQRRRQPANNSRVTMQLKQHAEMIAGSPALAVLQRYQDLANHSRGMSQPDAAERVQRETKPNHTGLPERLKSGVESLSGLNMDHVRVHYNSGKPAQLQAHAYAQGSEIHLGPGQEKHLAHEAWHIVQQAQGRVRPTTQLKGSVSVNDDAGLEAEADAMGARALQRQPMEEDRSKERPPHASVASGGNVIVQAKASPENAGKIRGTKGYQDLEVFEQRYADYLLSDAFPDEVKTLKDVEAQLSVARKTVPPKYLNCMLAPHEVDRFLAKNALEEKTYVQVLEHRARIAGPLSPSERASLGTVRHVDDSQPTGTKQQGKESTPLDSRVEVSRWREPMNKGEKTPARVQTHDKQEAAGIGNFCVGCGTEVDLSQLQNDHQIPFSKLRIALLDLSRLLSRLPADEQLLALAEVGGKNWQRLFIQTGQVVRPTVAALLDYSNDLQNLLLICPTCNGLQAKGSDDVRTWFLEQPLFGQPFLDAYAGSSEFFGNPSPVQGWGAAAREWVQHQAEFFIASMKRLSQGKQKSMQLGATILIEDGRVANLPETNDDERRSKRREREQVDRLKTGFLMGTRLASHVLGNPGSEAPFSSDSDEEEESAARADEFRHHQQRRNYRKQRRSGRDDTRRSELLHMGMSSVTAPSMEVESSDVIDDVAMRRPWLANRGYAEALGIAIDPGPLFGRDAPTSAELEFVEHQRAAFAAWLNILIARSRSLGALHQAPPQTTNEEFLMMAPVQAAVLQRVLTAYGEGVVSGNVRPASYAPPQPSSHQRGIPGAMRLPGLFGSNVPSSRDNPYSMPHSSAFQVDEEEDADMLPPSSDRHEERPNKKTKRDNKNGEQ